MPAKWENEVLRISGSSFEVMGGCHKIRGTIWVPITRIIVFWGLFWGPTFLGDDPIGCVNMATVRDLKEIWGS